MAAPGSDRNRAEGLVEGFLGRDWVILNVVRGEEDCWSRVTTGREETFVNSSDEIA
jgi:hypothetical protein